MHRSRLQRASKQAAWEHTPKHCCTQIKARYALLIFYVINSCLPVISCSTMFTHNKQSCSEPNLIQCLIWNANKLWGRGYHLNLFPFCSLAVILHEPMLQLCTVANGRKRESVGGGGEEEERGKAGEHRRHATKDGWCGGETLATVWLRGLLPLTALQGEDLPQRRRKKRNKQKRKKEQKLLIH